MVQSQRSLAFLPPAIALYVAGLAMSMLALCLLGILWVGGTVLWFLVDLHSEWTGTEETFGDRLGEITGVLTRACKTMYPRGQRTWEDIAKDAPWPPNMKTPNGVNLTVWERNNTKLLSASENWAVAEALALAKLVYNSAEDKEQPYSRARKKMRETADLWDRWTWWDGFRPFRERMALTRGYVLKMLAYLEIALAPFVDPRRSSPLPWRGWVRLGERWRL